MSKGTWPTWEGSRRRREKAIALRRLGMSYKEIRALVGGSSASMSLWLRDIPVPPEDRVRLRNRQLEATRRTGQANHRRRLEKQARIRQEAALEVGDVTKRELFIAGIVAYAAEGTKQKPWSSKCATQFMNSDPRMIKLFLRWLVCLGVGLEDVTFRLAIHESADIDGALRYWAHLVGVPAETFRRTSLKRGNPRTPRRNTGSSYKGCLCVNVRRSTDLTRRIDGWFDGVLAGTEVVQPGSLPVPQPPLGAER